MSDNQFEFDYNLKKLIRISPKDHNFDMYVAPRYYYHYVINSYEKNTSNLILNHIKYNTIFIDIGAHYGYYSILVGKHHPGCHIIVYEPVPTNFNILKKNIKLNKLTNVEFYNMAASDKTEIKQFNMTEASDSAGFYEHPSTPRLQTIDVQAVDLNTHLGSTLKTPIVVKIDTEGHEISVLNGMDKILEKHSDVTLFIEFNPLCLGKAKVSPQDLLKKIDQLGFDIYIISEDQNLTFKLKYDELDLWERSLPEEYKVNLIVNLLCIRKSRSLAICALFNTAEIDDNTALINDLIQKLARQKKVNCTAVLPCEGPLSVELCNNGVPCLFSEYANVNLDRYTGNAVSLENLGDYNDLLSFIDTIDKINPDLIIESTSGSLINMIITDLLGIPSTSFLAESSFADGLKNRPHGTIGRKFASLTDFFKNGHTRLTGSLPGEMVIIDSPLRKAEISSLFDIFIDSKKHPVKIKKDVDRSHVLFLRQYVRNNFERISGLQQAITAKDEHISRLEQAVTAKDEYISGLQQALTAKDEHISGLQQALTAKDEYISGLQQALAAKDEYISELQQAVTAKDEHISGLEQNITQKAARVSELEQAVRKQDAKIEEIYSSMSWRLSAPLRFIYRVPKALFGRINRPLIRVSPVWQLLKESLLHPNIMILRIRQVRIILKQGGIKKLGGTLSNFTHQNTVAGKEIEYFDNTNAVTKEPVLAGYPFAPIGMGEHIRCTFRALQSVGFNIQICDLYKVDDQIDFIDEARGHIASQCHSGINIFHINGDSVEVALQQIGGRFPSGSYNIIYPVWELSIYPPEWAKQLDRFDEIWAPSKFVYSTISKAVSKPVLHMPLATELKLTSFLGRSYFGLPEDAYIFLFYFDFRSYIARKNPFASIKAFETVCAARPNMDMRLVIKLNRPGGFSPWETDFPQFMKAIDQCQFRDKIIIIDKILSDNEVKNLVRCCDCFVSLHRSEGFGRGMAESMFLDKPVIATGYSGNMDFMNKSNSIPVPYKLVEVMEGQYPYGKGQVWAEPDIAKAGQYMIKVIDDRNYGRTLGETAGHYIRTYFSYKAIGLKYMKRINQIIKGEFNNSSI